MAVRILQEVDIPKRKLTRIPRIFQTVDWKIALTKMAEGLKPGEAIMIVLSPEEMKQYGIKSIRTASRPIKQHVKIHGLPYKVTAKNTAEGGVIVIAAKSAVAEPRKRA